MTERYSPEKSTKNGQSSGIFAGIETRDVIALIGLLLLGSGLYFIYWPLSLIAPGVILIFKTLYLPRDHGAHGHTREH